MKRFLLLFAAILLCVFLALELLPNKEEGAFTLPSPGGASSLTSIQESFPTSEIERHSLALAPQFVDQLTNLEIDPVSIHLVLQGRQGGLSSSILASEVDLNLIRGRSGFWKYSLESTSGPRPMRIPLQAWAGGTSSIMIPWTSELLVKPLSGSSSLLEEAVVEVAFPDEENWARVESGEFAKVDLLTPSRAISGLLSTYEKHFQPVEWESLTEEKGGYRLSDIEKCGRVLLRINHSICGEVYVWSALVPGEIVVVEEVLSERPVFWGVVVDENGSPVPRASLNFLVQLNPNAPNLHVRPDDASGGRSALGSGDDWIYLLKKRARTNDKGEFKLDVPPGVGFGVEVFSSDRTAYACKILGPLVLGSQPNPIEIELNLYPSGGPEVKCIDPQGLEVSGVRLAVRIGGDPWGRSYPMIVSNKEEAVFFPWLPNEPHTIGVFIERNPLWESAGALAQLMEYDGTSDEVIKVYVKPVEAQTEH